MSRSASLIQKGFTLIELLLVIAILGILSAGLLVILNPVSKIHQANDSNVKGDVNTVSQALTGYFTNQTNQEYPPSFPKVNATNVLVTSSELKSLPPTVLNATAVSDCSVVTVATNGVCYTPQTGGSAICGTANPPTGPCEAVFAAKLSDGTWWCWDSSNGAPKAVAAASMATTAAGSPPKCY